MLTLSPCIECFWPQTSFADRIVKAAALGFEVFEFWGWWDKDINAVERAVKESGLSTSACCVRTGFGGAPYTMLLPEGKDHFVRAVRDCVPIAKRIGCKRFIVTTGNEVEGVPRDSQHKACVAALKAAAPVAEEAGFTLVLEPLNLLVDHRGYYLSTSAEGFAMIDEADSPAVKLLFDIYHQQITEGNLVPNITRNIGTIGHFHCANHPGRHELTVGEINYPYIFSRIAETAYDGVIGLEFSPSDHAATERILQDVMKLANP